METRILDGIAKPLTAAEQAGELLRRGEVVAIPTETVYGLAAAVTQPRALRALFEAKGRPQDNPLIVHLAEPGEIGRVADLERAADPQATRRTVALLVERFMPGPLTLVLPRRADLDPAVTAGLDSVAVRVPDHALARAIVRATGSPLAAPSANLSGRPSPTEARHVLQDLRGRIAAVVDGGPCRLGIESTVLRVEGERLVLLRPGSLSRTAIEAATGLTVVAPGAGEERGSPGTRHRHYAPRAALELCADGARLAARLHELLDAGTAPERLAVLCERDPRGGVLWLPLCATALYAGLREADERGVERILASLEGSCTADEVLRDRLERAARGAGA